MDRPTLVFMNKQLRKKVISMQKQPSCVWIKITENSKETTKHIKHTDLYSDSMDTVETKGNMEQIYSSIAMMARQQKIKLTHLQAEHMKIEILIEHSQCLMK